METIKKTTSEKINALCDKLNKKYSGWFLCNAWNADDIAVNLMSAIYMDGDEKSHSEGFDDHSCLC